MRQSFRERREHLHRGMRTPRLTTMFLMAAILGLVFLQLRNPDNWRAWGATDDDNRVAPQPVSARSTASSLDTGSLDSGAKPSKDESASGEPNGPTDLDAEEIEEIKPSLSVVDDGSLETKPAEQPAYFRILDWVDHQSTDALRKRAKRDFFYDNLIHSPESLRLQIVEVKLTVLQIVQVMGLPKDGRPQPLLTSDGSKIYEVRGVSQESGSNLYFGMVTDIPPGTPLGASINLDARLVGYFFKVQGYITKPQQLAFEAHRTKLIVPLKAPLIVGRLIPFARPAETAANNTPVWVLASAGGIAIIGMLGWIAWSSRRRRSVPAVRLSSTRPIDPDEPNVDTWLNDAQSRRFSSDPMLEPGAHSEGAALDLAFGDRFTGNIFESSGESKIGDRVKNGLRSTDRNHFMNGSAGQDPEVRENDSPSN
jgi:hypothetical protein